MRCRTEGIQRLKSAVTKRKGRGFKASKFTLVNYVVKYVASEELLRKKSDNRF